MDLTKNEYFVSFLKLKCNFPYDNANFVIDYHHRIDVLLNTAALFELNLEMNSD